MRLVTSLITSSFPGAVLWLSLKCLSMTTKYRQVDWLHMVSGHFRHRVPTAQKTAGPAIAESKWWKCERSGYARPATRGKCSAYLVEVCGGARGNHYVMTG